MSTQPPDAPSPTPDPVAARARTTFDLFQTALDLKRQQLRQRLPGATPEEIAEAQQGWLRANANGGDAQGYGRPRITTVTVLEVALARLVEDLLTNPPFGKRSSITVVNEEGESEREALTYNRPDFWTTMSNKQLNFVQHVKSLLEVARGLVLRPAHQQALHAQRAPHHARRPRGLRRLLPARGQEQAQGDLERGYPRGSLAALQLRRARRARQGEPRPVLVARREPRGLGKPAATARPRRGDRRRSAHSPGADRGRARGSAGAGGEGGGAVTMRSGTRASIRAPFALLLLIGGSLSVMPQAIFAQPSVNRATDAQAAELIEDWRAELREAEVDLTSGKPKDAHRRVARVLSEMTERVIEPAGIAPLLALALALRALAAAGQGDVRDAIWDWQVAVQLFPELEAFDLAGHGDAGRLLLAHPPGTAPEGSAPVQFLLPGTTKPRAIRNPKPSFPRAKLGLPAARVQVGGVIGTDGIVHTPRLDKVSGEPTLLVLSMDALKEWRYEPATKDGEPIAVRFSLSLNFETR